MLFEAEHSKSNYFCLLEFDDVRCLPHCQTSFEIVWVERGFVQVELMDKTVLVREGECIWILPYDIHRVTTPENSRVTVSIFSTDYVEDFYALVKDKALCQPVIGFPPDALTIVKGGHENKLMMKSVLYGLCAKAAAHGITAEKRGLKSDQSLEILLYIQEHYKEPITLATLAKQLGYSYAYTSTIFKAAFRQSFSATVNAYRLDEAVRLLKQRTHAVTEIVHLCGFSTIRNFNIVFKQHYGVPPSKWLQE